MTEYDYSPDALERHKAHMEGVGRWAKEASFHPPADPYSIPTPHLNAMRLPPEQSSGRRHRSKSIGGGSQPSPTFPVPVRSSTQPVIPHSGELYGDSRQGRSSHSLHYGQQHSDSSSKKSRKSSRSHSRSRPTTSGGFIPPVPALPPNPRSSSHRRSNTQQTIRVDTGNGGYVLLPNDGRTYEIMSPESYSSKYSYAPPPTVYQPSPTKQAPLLKRIFGGLTGNKSRNQSPAPPPTRQRATTPVSFQERRSRRQSF